jgi:hypothetical protein
VAGVALGEDDGFPAIRHHSSSRPCRLEILLDIKPALGLRNERLRSEKCANRQDLPGNGAGPNNAFQGDRRCVDCAHR